MIWILLAVATLGAFIYWATDKPKVAELARLMYGCGLLAALVYLAVKGI